jgi:riboflavin synthase
MYIRVIRGYLCPMFTGIIESLGRVAKIVRDQSNIHFTVESDISSALKIDQSVSHNGVCLTVTELPGPRLHTVTAIDETLNRTNLSNWEIGTEVNLERCLAMNGRLDGHLVQGHVDTLAKCLSVKDMNGSWVFTFKYPLESGQVLVDKGSVCLNGVSLTVVSPEADQFSVAIIPYTWEHTNFKHIKAGDTVNIEFDIIGKYVARFMSLRAS